MSEKNGVTFIQPPTHIRFDNANTKYIIDKYKNT